MSRRIASLTLLVGLIALGCGGTPGTGKITSTNADKIKVGMSEGEVASIIGPAKESAEIQVPNTGLLKENGKAPLTVPAKLSTWKEGKNVIVVTYYEGKVVTAIFGEGDAKPKGKSPDDKRLSEEPFKQTGAFHLIAGEEGVVNYPIPYALPANVEFSGFYAQWAVVKEATATGFKWKAGKEARPGEVTWTARGIKATKLP